jgi:hypothetical protein
MDLLALENRDNYNVSKFRCTPGKGVHIESKTTRLLDQRPTHNWLTMGRRRRSVHISYNLTTSTVIYKYDPFIGQFP